MGIPAIGELRGHMTEIEGKASQAFILKVIGAGLNFGFHVVLARLIGAEGSGIYFLALTITVVCAVLGRLGLDNALLRFAATAAAEENWHAIHGLHRKGILAAGIASSGIAVGMFSAAPWLSVSLFDKPELTDSIRWMSLSVVPLALLTLYAQLLKGLKKTNEAISVLSVWVPLLSLAGLLALLPWRGVRSSIWAYDAAVLATLAIAFGYWRRATPVLKETSGWFDTEKLKGSAVPLFVMACLQLVNQWSSQLVLGIWGSAAEIGIFGVANRTSLLISFVIIPVSSIAAPKFAALYIRGDTAGLESTARQSGRLMLLVGGPLFLIFMVAPERVMALFGGRFPEGASILMILSAGQFLNLVAGLATTLLMMCGQERMVRNCFAVSATATLVLNMILIPRWGAAGAATAALGGFLLQNLLSVGLTRRRMGIWTLPGFRTSWA